jgi:hypothetical protein
VNWKLAFQRNICIIGEPRLQLRAVATIPFTASDHHFKYPYVLHNSAFYRGMTLWDASDPANVVKYELMVPEASALFGTPLSFYPSCNTYTVIRKRSHLILFLGCGAVLVVDYKANRVVQSWLDDDVPQCAFEDDELVGTIEMSQSGVMRIKVFKYEESSGKYQACETGAVQLTTNDEELSVTFRTTTAQVQRIMGGSVVRVLVNSAPEPFDASPEPMIHCVMDISAETGRLLGCRRTASKVPKTVPSFSFTRTIPHMDAFILIKSGATEALVYSFSCEPGRDFDDSTSRTSILWRLKVSLDETISPQVCESRLMLFCVASNKANVLRLSGPVPLSSSLHAAGIKDPLAVIVENQIKLGGYDDYFIRRVYLLPAAGHLAVHFSKREPEDSDHIIVFYKLT